MRKPRADVVRNRERLLAAAVDVFRCGGSAASLEAVARGAGVGIGTLYRHFPTREALFEAVYRREVEELARLAERLSEGPDPVEALRQWSRGGIQLVATKHGMPHPTLMRFVLKLLANLTDPRDGDAMDRIINGLTKVAPAV